MAHIANKLTSITHAMRKSRTVFTEFLAVQNPIAATGQGTIATTGIGHTVAVAYTRITFFADLDQMIATFYANPFDFAASVDQHITGSTYAATGARITCIADNLALLAVCMHKSRTVFTRLKAV